MSQSTRILDFSGYLLDSSGQKDLLLWIESPQQTTGEADFHCEIGGSIFPRPMKIYGEDPEQAKALAYLVVKRRLTGKTLLDSTGTPVELPSPSAS